MFYLCSVTNDGRVWWIYLLDMVSTRTTKMFDDLNTFLLGSSPNYRDVYGSGGSKSWMSDFRWPRNSLILNFHPRS